MVIGFILFDEFLGWLYGLFEEYQG
jgi:hypothetical protein